MEVLKLEKVDVEIGLIVRDVDDPSIYALIQLEDLEEIVKFYNSFNNFLSFCCSFYCLTFIWRKLSITPKHTTN